jgi:4-hydroxy-tetrahydrodipicolinate synthase
MDVLKGIHSAMVTPFTGDGSAVDEPALRALVDRMAAGGIQGLVPCGSTGEVTSLTMDERRRVTEIVQEQADGRLQVVPHVGALVTRDAVALARHAEACGASAVLAITPFYEPIGEDEVIAYYAAIADAISIPICVYNIPAATGVDLGVEGLVRIARAVPSVSFVKDSTGDFSQVQRLAMDHADEIRVLTGADNHVLPALQHGAHGVIVGAPNLVVDELGRMWAALERGDHVAAWEEWRGIFPLMELLVSGGYYAALVKGALALMGHDVGVPRDPIMPLRGELLEAMKQVLARRAGATVAS